MFKERENEKKFEKIYGDHYSRLYYFALSLLTDEDDCRDIIDDIFLNVWKNIENIETESVGTYLMSAVHNRVIDRMRRDKLHRQYSEEYIRQATIFYSDYSVELEKDRLVEQMLNSLKPPKDEILRLCYFERKRYADVAEMMGISPNTVKKLCTFPCKKLKNMHNSSDSTWDESLFRHNYDAYVKLKDIEAYASEHIPLAMVHLGSFR